MQTIKQSLVEQDSPAIVDIIGLSTDTKPEDVGNGSTFFEMDTGKKCYYNREEELWITEADAYLSSITLDTSSIMTTYMEGETFDPTGLVVTATYTDGTSTVVDNYDYLPAGALSADDTEVTIIYGDNGVRRSKKITIEVAES